MALGGLVQAPGRPWLAALGMALVLGAAGSASCGKAFESGDPGTTTQAGVAGTGTPSGTAVGGGGTTASGAPTGTSTGGGGTTTTTSPGGGGGGPPSCAHGLCSFGDALDPACDPCVAAVCLEDGYCCSNYWDTVCTAHGWWSCGLHCGPTNTVTCDQQYALVDGYSSCSGVFDPCVFAMDNTSMSCDEACESFGGECQSAQSGSCPPGGAVYSCDLSGDTVVTCTCTLGCGGGDPCIQPLSCVGGICQ